MFAIPELGMPQSQTATTVYNGKREVWMDYKQAKAYFLELMMSTDGEEHERAECVLFSSCMDLTSAAMRINKQRKERVVK